MKQKNENAPRPGGAGRKPKADPAVFRYSISFNTIDHARFLALFDQSGMRTEQGTAYAYLCNNLVSNSRVSSIIWRFRSASSIVAFSSL